MTSFFRPIAPLASVLLLSACVTAPTTKSSLQEVGANALKDDPCTAASSPICLFINSPVRVDTKPFRMPTRKADFFRTVQSLEFVDNQKRRWLAPPQTLTDGASIPQIFIPIVGDPRSPQFANAAAIHDAYCGLGNENGPSYHARRWQEVHRMFFDTLVVGGTPEIKAKVMFAAVYLAGPRWNDSARSMANIAPAVKVQGMKQAKAFIESDNPDLNRLQDYLDWLEGELRKRQADTGNDDGPYNASLGNPGTTPTDPTSPGDPTDPASPGYPTEPTSPGDPAYP